jgi:hypothetical protein
MSDYRVLRKQERWVMTIVYDVDSPEEALASTDWWDTDWELWGVPHFTEQTQVFKLNTEEVK